MSQKLHACRKSHRDFWRPALLLATGLLATMGLSSSKAPTFRTPGRQAGNASSSPGTPRAAALKLSDLLRGGLPAGLVQFEVPDATGHYAWISHLALLKNDLLEIYKPEDDTRQSLVLQFSLAKPSEVNEWEELTAFPSGYYFPGLIIYGSGETPREETTVVCYVRGKFQVVFRGGVADFVDLDLDGYPEILEWDSASEAAAVPTKATVWAWNGEKYVVAVTVPGKEFCTKQVLEAVRRIAAMRK